MSLLIAVVGSAVGAIWFAVALQWWGARQRTGQSPRSLDVVVWFATVTSCAGVAIGRLGLVTAQAGGLVLGAAILAAVLLAAILSQVGVANRRHAIWNPLSITVTAFASVQVISLVINGGPYTVNTAGQILGLTFLPGIVILTLLSGADLAHVTRLAARVSSTVIVASLVLLPTVPVLIYGGRTTDFRRLPLPGIPERFAGLTPHPNLIGATAVICVLTIFAVKMRYRFLIAPACLVTLLLAEARVAAVSLVLAGAVMWIVASRVWVLRAIAVGIAGLAALPSVLGFLADEQGLTSDVVSVNGRTRIWSIVGEYWDDRPLFGWGPLAFQPEAGTPFSSDRSTFFHAHQQVLEGLVEGGILGFILIILLLVLIVATGVKHRKTVVLPLAIYTAVQCVTEVFLSLHLYGLNYTIVPAFLVLAVIASSTRKLKDSDEDRVGLHERLDDTPDRGVARVVRVDSGPR